MEMLDQLRNIRIKYNKVPAEMKATSKKVHEVQRRVEKLPDFVLDEIHKSEDRTHDEITDQVSSLRSMNETRLEIVEGRMAQAKERQALVEKIMQMNDSDMDMCERIIRLNITDILKIDARQTQVERKIRNLERTPFGIPSLMR